MEKIASSEWGSQRQMVKQMRTKDGGPIDQSALSRMLRGEREMTFHDAEQISKLLKVSLVVVLSKAGMRFPELDLILEALEYYGVGGQDDGERARNALALLVQ